MRQDSRGLKQAAENAKAAGRPNAAMDAADLIWQAALDGPGGGQSISELRRTRLIDLLTRNQIKWERKPKPAQEK